MPKERVIYDVDTELDFGKYKGQKLSDVIEKDLHWVKWAIESIQWFDVTPAADRLIAACKQPYKKHANNPLDDEE
jgi:hypothetical protein